MEQNGAGSSDRPGPVRIRSFGREGLPCLHRQVEGLAAELGDDLAAATGGEGLVDPKPGTVVEEGEVGGGDAVSVAQELIVSLMNLTEPSQKAMFTPPGCWLVATVG